MDEREKNTNTVIANIAAQLRGPLGMMYGCINAANPTDSTAVSARAKKNYFMLVRMVGNLSAAEELNKDSLFRLVNVDIAEIFYNICEQIALLISSERGIKLKFVCKQENIIIGCDKTMLERLLMNLLSNAVKFTPDEGTVTVELLDEKPNLRLVVSDDGYGISAEKLEHLFDRYLHPQMMDPVPHGLGLGLPLCKRIAEGHGGRIFVESKSGVGTKVTVFLPNKRTQGLEVRENRFDYTGGFNHMMVEMSDALSAQEYEIDD